MGAFVGRALVADCMGFSTSNVGVWIQYEFAETPPTLRMVVSNPGVDLQNLEDMRGKDISYFHNGSIFHSLRASFVNLCGILDVNATSRLVF